MIRLFSNPLIIRGNIKGKDIPMLIDTGADVSLINKKLVNIKEEDFRDANVRLKSAGGNEVNVIGKLINKPDVSIEGIPLEVGSIIISGEPIEYMIIGADAIKRNKERMAELITKKILSGKTLKIKRKDNG